MSTISIRLRSARMKAGLSQTELAELSGKTQQTIANIENGVSLMPRKMEKIAKILKIDLIWLLYGKVSDNSLLSMTVKREEFILHIELVDWKDISKIRTGDSAMKTILDLNLIPNDNCVALKIDSDSMCVNSMSIGMKSEISFLENDIIIVDQARKPKSCDYIVVSFPDTEKSMLRKYFIDEGKAYLAPLNLDYPLIEFTPEIKICGVVISRLSILDS